LLVKAITSGNGKEISANVLKGVIDDAAKFGLLDQRIVRGEITQTMRSLGWELSVIDRLWYKK
jgi:hypothetical protein